MKRLKIPIIDIKKYGGKQVAIVQGRIVAAGETTKEVLEKVQTKFPKISWSEILLISVPKGLTVVYKI